MIFFGSKDIKAYVKKWIEQDAAVLSGKTVIDMPAGNGVSTDLLTKAGAIALPYDLFPEFFRVKGLSCAKADLSCELPIVSDSADVVLCQEGIEHVSDQLKCLRELSRILKVGGRLMVTTPNYSNLRSRVSYLLNESELMGKLMPPNEVDSVWFSEGSSTEMYFGHINLIGVQKLRLFGVLSGLKIKKIHPNRVNYTALMMFPFLYPLICYFSWASFRRLKRKKGAAAAEKVRESFSLAISPRILLEGHLMVEFEKVCGSSPKNAEAFRSALEFVT